MKKLFLILTLTMIGFFSQAQESITTVSVPPQSDGTHRVYAELLGASTNLLGLNKNVAVSLDLGQFQSMFKKYELLDENGKTIKFNSMVQAMNYMGERGWKFVQAYIVTINKQNVYHWLMYKDITNDSQIHEGLHVKNTESDVKKESKTEASKPNYSEDDIYEY